MSELTIVKESKEEIFDPFGADIDLCSAEMDTNPFVETFSEKEHDNIMQATDSHLPTSSDEVTPDEPDSPIQAALKSQEEKTITSIFSQYPVFSYNGAIEDIEDVEQTFDDLRETKAADFPEFDEAKSVSWSVTYGKIVKPVPNPTKAKIGEFKKQMETSKEFLDSLKKSKDKTPKCIIKPQVYMQKKGIAGYKGIFPNLETARESDKVICFIPGRDGSVYEMRKNDMGEFITHANNVVDFDAVRAGFKPALPFGLL